MPKSVRPFRAPALSQGLALLAACLPPPLPAMPGGGEARAMQVLLQMSLTELLDVPIVTASKRAEKMADTPANILVVTRQQMRERGYVNLIDLLQDLPSVDVQRMSEETRYHQITLRGHLGNNKFLILQDGVRIDSPSGEIIPVADNFPLDNAKQVEILYGPAAALYGADAFAGVINIISEDPRAHDEARLNIARGSDGYVRHSLYATHGLGEHAGLSLGGHAHNADTADLAALYPDLFRPVDAVTLDGRTLLDASAQPPYTAPARSYRLFARLDLGEAFSAGFNRSFFRSLTSTGARPATLIFDADAAWNTQIDTFYGKYRHSFGEHLHSETLAQYASYEVAPTSKFKNLYVDFQDAYKYAWGSKRALEEQITWRFAAAHTLVGGLVLEDYYSLPKSADLAAPYDTAEAPAAQDLYYLGTDDTLPVQFMATEYTNYAGYLQLQSVWSDQWSSALGLRYDKNSRYAGTFNPRLGAVYKPRAASVLKFSYGESFRAPSVYDALGHYGAFSGQTDADGNYTASLFAAPHPDLRPEKSRTLEFSLSESLTPDFTLSANAYYTRLRDLIARRVTPTPIQFIPGGVIASTSINDNLGEGTYWGGDLGLNYQTKLGGAWSANLWGNYSYIDGRLKANGGQETDLPYVAAHKLKLGATLRYLDKYFLTSRVYLIDRANTGKPDKASPGKLLQAPAYAVADLRAGAYDVFLKNLSVYLDIANLFDRRYYHAGGTSGTDFVAAPQQPRSIALSLEYRF